MSNHSSGGWTIGTCSGCDIAGVREDAAWDDNDGVREMEDQDVDDARDNVASAARGGGRKKTRDVPTVDSFGVDVKWIAPCEGPEDGADCVALGGGADLLEEDEDTRVGTRKTLSRGGERT